MDIKPILLVGLLAPTVVSGCFSQGGGGEGEPVLVEECSGNYECTWSGNTVGTSLAWRPQPYHAKLQQTVDGCFLDVGLYLQPEGVGYDWVSYAPVTWSGTVWVFDFVVDGQVEGFCRRPPDESKPSPGSRCVGSADSCYGRASGDCSTQDGCYQSSHVKYNGTIEYDCSGSAKWCSDYDMQSACESQDGCRWE